MQITHNKLSMDSKLYNFHNFEKANLVTNYDGTDTYICKDCGLKGKRFGINDTITLVRPSKIKLSKCNGKKGIFELEEKNHKVKELVKTGIKIEILDDTHLYQFGLKKGQILETLDYSETGLGGVWVESKEFTDPVRILEFEYKEI